MLVNTMFMAKL